MTSHLPRPALLFIRNFSLFLILVTCDLILHQISKNGLPCPGTVSAEDVQGAQGCCCLWAYPQAGPPPPLSLSFLICKMGPLCRSLRAARNQRGKLWGSPSQTEAFLPEEGRVVLCGDHTALRLSERKAAVDCLCPQRAYVKSRLPG